MFNCVVARGVPAMPRCRVALLLTAGLLLAAWSPGRAEEDEPSFNGKKLSYWLDLLEKGKDQKDRRRGIIGLEQIGHQGSRKVTPALVKALREDKDAKVRATAARAVGRVTARAVERARDTKQDDSLRTDPVRDALATALRTEKEDAVREAAALALGDLGPDARGAVGALGQALKDKNAATARAAVQSLRRLGKEARDAQADLQALLADKKADVEARVDAAHCLGQIRPDAAQALPVLREALADEKAEVRLRRAVAEALGKLGKEGADAATTLAAVLAGKDTSSELRLAAAVALDQFGPEGKAAIPALIKATGDPELVRSMGDNARFIRCLAMHALARMGKDLDKDRKAAVAALVKATEDPNVEVCVSALETLGALGADGLAAEAEAVTKKLDAILQREGRKSVREAAQSAREKILSPPKKEGSPPADKVKDATGPG
jgi:HEAT repeat protein